jgi:hypothetical protein
MYQNNLSSFMNWVSANLQLDSYYPFQVSDTSYVVFQLNQSTKKVTGSVVRFDGTHNTFVAADGELSLSAEEQQTLSNIATEFKAKKYVS